MKNTKLFEAITKIKEHDILESQPQKAACYRVPKPHNRLLLRYACAAAVFAVILFGIGMANEHTAPTESPDTADHSQIVISGIKIAPRSKTMAFDLWIPEARSGDSDHYWLGDMTIAKRETSEIEDGTSLQCYGFYTDDTAWSDPKLYNGFQSPTNAREPLDPVRVEGEVTQLPELEFHAAVAHTDLTLPVQLTPYSLTIQPTTDWRNAGDFYYVTATATDGTTYYLCSLPLLDDRKASEKKAHPLPTPYEDLDVLGDGFPSASETKHGGVQYIFNETIDPDTIEKIEIRQLDLSDQ